MPRKNGKSLLGAGIALYGLMADEYGAEVYSCAGEKEQARIVFGEAKRMVQMNPDLAEKLKVYRDAIEFPARGSVYRVLSAEAYSKEGLNPSTVIFDEVHVQPNDELWNVMTLGSGTRPNPLVLGITTAGYDEESLCYRLYDYGKRIESGEINDPSFFFKWYEPAVEDCDFRDPKIWAECNPALGDFLYEEDFDVAVKTTPEAAYRRYRLNQWVPSSEMWLPYGSWDACEEPDFELNPELPTRVMIDVGVKHDSSAVGIAQRQGTRTVVRAKIWENPHPKGSQAHDSYKFNIGEIEEYLRGLYRKFPEPTAEVDGELLPGPEFNYDPHFFERSAQELEGDGLAMVEFPQNNTRLCPASQALYELIVSGELAHDGDPALRRHVHNAVALETDRGWRIAKKKATKKIDGCIAIAGAAHRAQEPDPEEVAPDFVLLGDA